MKTGMGAALAAAMAVAAWAGPAAADEARGISGPEVVELLQAQGYRAKLGVDSEGDPKIETAMSGVTATILFYDCEDGRCGSLQFRCGLDLADGSSLQVVNRFNSQYRYANAWLDEEQDPFLEMDFEIEHARHAEQVASQLGLWEELLADFLRETGFNEPAEATPGNLQ